MSKIKLLAAWNLLLQQKNSEILYTVNHDIKHVWALKDGSLGTCNSKNLCELYCKGWQLRTSNFKNMSHIWKLFWDLNDDSLEISNSNKTCLNYKQRQFRNI